MMTTSDVMQEDPSNSQRRKDGSQSSVKDMLNITTPLRWIDPTKKEDPFANLLRNVVEAAMASLSPAAEPPGMSASTAESVTTLLRASFSEKDVLLATPWNMGQSTGSEMGEGLKGGLDQVMAQTQATVKELAGTPAVLRSFLSSVLAPTLQRFERQSTATPEELVDLVLMPLASHFTPRDEGVRHFVAELRNCMDKQALDDRKEGWYQTIAAMGDWLGELTDSAESCHQAIAYYHGVLCACQTLSPRRIGVVANNMAGRLDLLSDHAETRRVCNRLHALSVIASFKDSPPLEDDERGDMVVQLFRRFGFAGASEDISKPMAFSHVVLTMANVSNAWINLDATVTGKDGATEHDEDWLALISALAGTLGAVLNPPEDYRRIAATLFNAGVCFSRLTDTKSMPERQSADSRVVLNALGLVWALRKSNGDMPVALSEMNGLSCTVNLFGALLKSGTSLTQDRLVQLRNFARSVQSWRPNIPFEEQLDYRRLDSAWEKLHLGTIDASEPVPHGQFVEHLQALFSSFFDRNWQDLFSLDEEKAAYATAEIAGKTLSYALGSDAMTGFCGELLELAMRLSDIASKADGTTWVPFYTGRTGTDALSSYEGPLVESGVLDAEQWDSVLKSSNISTPSLYHVLRNENLGWIL